MENYGSVAATKAQIIPEVAAKQQQLVHTWADGTVDCFVEQSDEETGLRLNG